MEDMITRRLLMETLGRTGALAASGLLPDRVEAEQDTPAEKPAQHEAERRHVIDCGFTEAEADCWLSLADAAGKFLDLPKLHVMDDHEIAQAIHVLQYRLMARPAYRKYRGPVPATEGGAEQPPAPSSEPKPS